MLEKPLLGGRCSQGGQERLWWGGTRWICSFSFSFPVKPSRGEPRAELPVTVLLRGTVAEPGALGSVHGTAWMSWRGLRPLDCFHEAPGLSWHWGELSLTWRSCRCLLHWILHPLPWKHRERRDRAREGAGRVCSSPSKPQAHSSSPSSPLRSSSCAGEQILFPTAPHCSVLSLPTLLLTPLHLGDPHCTPPNPALPLRLC